MPTRVIENALDYIDCASRDFWSDSLTPEQQLKYSTTKLYEGIELLLKARLMQEHYSFILKNIDDFNETDFTNGDFVSVNYKTARSRLKSFCNIELEPREHNAYDLLRKSRNRYVHFHCDESREAVVGIQIQAWHHILARLEGGLLGDLNEVQAELLDSIRDNMLHSEEFLRLQYEAVLPEIEEERAKGLLVLTCEMCGMDSTLAGDDGESRCPVCRSVVDFYSLADTYESRHNPLWCHPKYGPDDDVAWCTCCDAHAMVLARGSLVDIAREKLSDESQELADDEGIYICLACGEPGISYYRKRCGHCGSTFFTTIEEYSCPAC